MSPACALAQADATGTAVDVAAGCDDVDPVDCAVAVGTTTGGAATLDGTAPAEGTAPAVDVALGAEAGAAVGAAVGDVVAVVLGEAVGAAE
jgi:hypothetical protein